MTADRSAYYLRHVPVKVVQLSARISDAALLLSWDAIASAIEDRPTHAVTIPGVGLVEPAQLRTVWGWLVDVVKSRHVAEWEARNDADYARITADAAHAQGVEPAAVDWDAVPDEAFDGKPSALDHAVAVLREHASK